MRVIHFLDVSIPEIANPEVRESGHLSGGDEEALLSSSNLTANDRQPGPGRGYIARCKSLFELEQRLDQCRVVTRGTGRQVITDLNGLRGRHDRANCLIDRG